MKKFWIAVTTSLVVLAVLGMGLLWLKAPEAVPALSQNSERRTITVSGEGRISVKPDVVQATVGVETMASTAQEALSENNQRSAAVIAKLKELGIAEKDIQTASFSISPQYDRDGRLIGYRVVHALRFTVRQLDRAGEILDQAIAAGATTVRGIEFTVGNPDPLLSQARALAVAEAQKKAQELAQAAGVSLGPPLTISDAGASLPAAPVGPPAPTLAAVPLQPGEMTVTARVQIVFRSSRGVFKTQVG